VPNDRYIVWPEDTPVSEPAITLPAVDELRLSIIMDNALDVLMASSEVARRLPLRPDLFERPPARAEHGFSALLEVRRGDGRGQVMFDTGVSRDGILHNMDLMEIDPSGLRAIVLSHGHADHTLGLEGLLGRVGARRLPLVLHPDAYLERKVVLPTGTELQIPPPKRADLRREGVAVIEEVGPSLLVDDMVLVSGEVARTTEFEKGFTGHMAKRDGAWGPDPLIRDDQCAIVNVRDRGLVIVTGCGHAGIVNIVRHAQALTGVQPIHAVVGGFHLTGGLFEPIIPATVAALRAIGPRYLVPGHCTGWSAALQLAQALPQAYLPNSVGTTYVF
jgi:7,8-dihydropterin-6-yl-methyl-4-(beta-D-ribofuranosyl)aminobenzene 5'-phosphate synthase